jgi:hypothetical protein
MRGFYILVRNLSSLIHWNYFWYARRNQYGNNKASNENKETSIDGRKIKNIQPLKKGIQGIYYFLFLVETEHSLL